MEKLKAEHVQKLKRTYPAGTRVELVQIDSFRLPAAGPLGTVCGVDDSGHLLVHWDNDATKSRLNVLWGVDRVRRQTN